MTECVHSERCGGCVFMGLPMAEQHARKRSRVRTALAPYSPLARLEVADVVGAEPAEAYRMRAKLVVSRDRAIGLYTREGHEVVDIPGCQVLSPALLTVAAGLRELLPPGAAQLFGVDLREVQDEAGPGVLVTLIGPPEARAAVNELVGRVGALPAVLGVAWSERAADSAQMLGRTPEPLAGAAVVRDRLEPAGPYHYAAHGGFAQAHRGQAARLARQIEQQLTAALGTLEGARVLELYAGAGALALRLAQLGARPLLVERFEPALAQASRAAREQGFPELRTRVADAEVALAELVAQRERFDAVVVNPPRRGLSPAVRARLAELAPRALVYVSCDPDTLARDLTDLAQRGLAARTLTPYDMMPLAGDVESLVLLQPAAPTPLPILYEDDELLAVDKPPHLPTIPGREHAQSVLVLLQSQRALPALHAVHRLDLGTSGICLFVKQPGAVAGWSKALAAGQKHYLALVRGRAHEKGIIKTPLAEDGALRAATTRYSRVQSLGGHSLVRARPVQGRTHQVRRHLAAIGHPVLGDARHGDLRSNRHFEHRHALDRTFLHLSKIELVHPRSGEPLTLTSELAPDLAAVVERLRRT